MCVFFRLFNGYSVRAIGGYNLDSPWGVRYQYGFIFDDNELLAVIAFAPNDLLNSSDIPREYEVCAIKSNGRIYICGERVFLSARHPKLYFLGKTDLF